MNTERLCGGLVLSTMSGDFRRFWGAGLVSGLGDGMRQAALPLLLAALTRDPLAVSLVTAATFLPWVFGPLVGAIVDRQDRRRLIVLAQLLRGGAVLALAVVAAVSTVTPGIVYAIAFLLGLGEVLVDTVIQSAVPQLAGSLSLEQANGRVQAADQLANRTLGPPVGAVLFAAAVWLPFVADAVTFVVAAVMLVTIRTPLQPPRTGPRTTIAEDVREGLRRLFADRVLRPLLLVLFVANVATMTYAAVAVLLIVDVLDRPETVFGLLLAVAAAGGVVGGLSSATVTARFGRPLMYVGAPALTAVALAAIVLRPTLPVVFVGAFVANIGGAAFNVSTASLRQLLTPSELLGRVSSSFRAIALSGVPVGAVLGGLVASAYGVLATFAVGMVLFLLLSVAMIPISRRLPTELAGQHVVDGTWTSNVRP